MEPIQHRDVWFYNWWSVFNGKGKIKRKGTGEKTGDHGTVDQRDVIYKNFPFQKQWYSVFIQQSHLA